MRLKQKRVQFQVDVNMIIKNDCTLTKILGFSSLFLWMFASGELLALGCKCWLGGVDGEDLDELVPPEALGEVSSNKTKKKINYYGHRTTDTLLFFI